MRDSNNAGGVPTHRCAAEGCHQEIRNTLLMCLPHWRRVPALLQREVYRTYRAWHQAPLAGSLAKRRAYLDAVKHAVSAVREKEIKRQVRADAHGDVLDFNQGV